MQTLRENRALYAGATLRQRSAYAERWLRRPEPVVSGDGRGCRGARIGWGKSPHGLCGDFCARHSDAAQALERVRTCRRALPSYLRRAAPRTGRCGAFRRACRSCKVHLFGTAANVCISAVLAPIRRSCGAQHAYLAACSATLRTEHRVRRSSGALSRLRHCC